MGVRLRSEDMRRVGLTQESVSVEVGAVSSKCSLWTAAQVPSGNPLEMQILAANPRCSKIETLGVGNLWPSPHPEEITFYFF